jgi:hypothetical protein
MKVSILLLLTTATLLACGQTAKIMTSPQGDTSAIRCLKLRHINPDLVTHERKAVAEIDTNHAHIYQYGNQLQYVMTYIVTNYGMGPNKTPQQTKQTHIRRLVLTRGEAYGAYYDERIGIYNQKVLADSLLKGYWVGGNKTIMHDSFTVNKLVSSGRLPGSDTLHEVWRYDVKKYPGVVYGTVNYYFVPLRPGLPYSLDTAAERAKGMTLAKLVNFFHTESKNIDGTYGPLEITLHYEMQEIPVTNAAELLPYFERQRRGEYAKQLAEVLK